MGIVLVRVELKSDAFSSFGSTYGMTEQGLSAVIVVGLYEDHTPRSARRISFLDDMMPIITSMRRSFTEDVDM